MIKTFKNGVQRNPEMQKEAWGTLASAIRTIFAKEQSKLSFEVLYRNAYNLVLWKQGEFLYNSIRDTVRTHLRARVELIAQQNGELPGRRPPAGWLRTLHAPSAARPLPPAGPPSSSLSLSLPPCSRRASDGRTCCCNVMHCDATR
eukprot:SAG22_NODE_46_length_24705_cov_89.861010_6_plen_146_part_00